MVGGTLNRLRRAFCLFAGAVSLAGGACAAEIDKVLFLIPGSIGGGWDKISRTTGDVLVEAGLVGKVSYDNITGGGGAKAVAHLANWADLDSNVLMVNSTPIVIRNLQKVFPQSFRNFTPIAGIINDYGAFVVLNDSRFQDMRDFVDAYKEEPKSIAIGGGSVFGGMDHLVVALALKGAGADPRKIKYVPYEAGGKAMASLLTGEIEILSTGLSEVTSQLRYGNVRILATTSPEHSAGELAVPTLIEQGIDVSFINWRGFFGPAGLSAEKKEKYLEVFQKMYSTSQWEQARVENGWVNSFRPGDEFTIFLSAQEKIIQDLMIELGFL